MQQQEALLINDALVSVRQALVRIASLSKAWPNGRVGLTLCAMAERLYSERRQRDAHFPAGLFGEPAWDLLLALFIAQEEGRRLNLAEAFAAAGIGASAGKTLVSKLKRTGLIAASVDPNDRRLRLLTLTREGSDRLTDYLARLL